MKKFLLYSAIPLSILAAITLFNVNGASAALCGCGCGSQNCGCQNNPNAQCQNRNGLGFKRLGRIELKAQILGMSVEQLKEKLSSGKTYREIIAEAGLTFEQYRDRMYEAVKLRNK